MLGRHRTPEKGAGSKNPKHPLGRVGFRYQTPSARAPDNAGSTENQALTGWTGCDELLSDERLLKSSVAK